MKLFYRTPVNRSMNVVAKGFDHNLFLYLNPPNISAKSLRFDGCTKGDKYHIELGLGAVTQNWIGSITDSGEDSYSWWFVDEGDVLPWPLKSWRHLHKVNRLSENSCEIVDYISYETEPKFLAPIILPVMKAVFNVRPARYKSYFEGKKNEALLTGTATRI